MQPKSIELINSSTCNLSCNYCFLCKNKAYAAVNENIVHALKDGSFFNNVCSSVDALGASHNSVERLGFWGGELSNNLDLVAQNLPNILQAFPNIHDTYWSTNMTVNVDKMLSYIEAWVKSGRRCHIHIQTSWDGPEDVLKSTRNVDYRVLENNIITLLKACNTMDLGQVTLALSLKPTLSMDLFSQQFSTVNGIKNYVGFFDDELSLFKKTATHRQIQIIDGPAPIVAVPTDHTVEDGILFSYIARLFDTVDYAMYPNYSNHVNFVTERAKPKHRGSPYNMRSFCGQMNGSLLFRYDGSICGCASSFMDDNPEHQEIMRNTQPDEYRKIQNALPFYFFNPAKASKEEIKNWKHRMGDTLAKGGTWQIGATAALMYELSCAKQISPIYAQDMDTTLRHAHMLGPLTFCYYNNLMETASPYVVHSGLIKLFCNGVLEYIDERDCNGK